MGGLEEDNDVHGQQKKRIIVKMASQKNDNDENGQPER